MRTDKLWIPGILCAAALLWSCSDPIPAVENERFMSLALMGSKEVPAVKKLNLSSTADTVFFIGMAYGGTPNYEQGDISAVIAADLSLVEAFNAANYTGYLPLPAETYALDRTTLQIANGRNSSDLAKLTVRMSVINMSDEYILPVTVKSVSGSLPLNEEMKTLYLVFRGDVDEDSGRARWVSAGASSEWQGTYPVRYVFDGNRNTYWHSDASGPMPQWFAVDMQGFKRISGFTWNNRMEPEQLAIPKHVKIETSMNGTEWTQALDVPELEQSRVMQVLRLERSVVARFFRVTVLSNWADAPYTYVAEIDIYSGEEPTVETDFAKHAWTVHSVSSVFDTWALAEYIFDGDRESIWHTATGGLPQWIIIDMQKSFTIHGILLWNRQNDHGAEPKNIVFEASDDPDNWKLLLDEPEMSNAWDHELDLPMTNPQKGRYLKITVNSNWSGANNWGWTYIAEITPY
ncbi:MAG: discoidin domain-containing protein [Bacteroidales bacterium]|jgi:hypothetical protein|nr:discoidin domain-containing protein [Bacteroidales bacterium]